MSADFWAGYISGAIGILIGNPLDLLKVRLQAGQLTSSPSSPHSLSAQNRSSYISQFTSAGSLIRGSTAPILGYGALNAILFMTYNRTSSYLTTGQLSVLPSGNGDSSISQANLWTTWIAGALGGLATWIISTPTELIKCRAQMTSSSSTNLSRSGPSITPGSLAIAQEIFRSQGLKGLYFGGVVTALRDSIGYGFYFWSYEALNRNMTARMDDNTVLRSDAAKVLLCGGLAGVVTWASVFPLDVVKTRVQTQQKYLLTPLPPSPSPFGASLAPAASTLHNERSPLVDTGSGEGPRRTMGALEVARTAYQTEGIGVFFRGLGICSVRAFIVNAAQWTVYEWIMRELDPSRKAAKSDSAQLLEI